MTMLQKILVGAGAVVLAVVLFGREKAAEWLEVAWRVFATGSFAMLLAVGVVAGCASIPLLGDNVTVGYSTLEAKQLSGCASGVEVFAPRASLQAIPGLMRGDAASLGDTPAKAMAKCLMLLLSLGDMPLD